MNVNKVDIFQLAYFASCSFQHGEFKPSIYVCSLVHSPSDAFQPLIFSLTFSGKSVVCWLCSLWFNTILFQPHQKKKSRTETPVYGKMCDTSVGKSAIFYKKITDALSVCSYANVSSRGVAQHEYLYYNVALLLLLLTAAKLKCMQWRLKTNPKIMERKNKAQIT